MGRPVEVRDPLHGAIEVSAEELRVLDHPLFQRLRGIRQLGFSDLSFPGATHHRYLHSVGAMHLAGRAFDSALQEASIPPGDRARLRALLRCAALLHDVGHAPLSHACEFAMPPVEALAVPGLRVSERGRRATHEDYTIKILVDSSLTAVVQDAVGLPAAAIAGLVDPAYPVDPRWYEAGGTDWRPLLQQLISSELDVDRMDYLPRDSHYTGVHYGVFDVGWLLGHLRAEVTQGRAYLALDRRALYAFEDFLIARYHMFLMVYFHFRSVAYEELLRRWIEGAEDRFRIPADIEAYAGVDDVALTAALRASADPWARRIVQRREYKLLLERHGAPNELDLSRVLVRLEQAGVPTIHAASKGALSKYFQAPSATPEQPSLPLHPKAPAPPPIFVHSWPYRGAPAPVSTRLQDSTELYERYAGQLLIGRVYVPAEDVPRAGALIHDIV